MDWKLQETELEKIYKNCTLCPRACHADRTMAKGACGCKAMMLAAKAMLHKWEEPCIAGQNGSGAVFFSGCTLRCVFCQNHGISHEGFGKEISTDRLSDIILELEAEGAETIEFVTASQFIPSVTAALDKVRHRIKLPLVFNCGGYESAEALRLLDGYMDVYLPDIKYFDDDTAMRYSRAPHYYSTAKAALSEMLRQTGKPAYNLRRSPSAPHDIPTAP